MNGNVPSRDDISPTSEANLDEKMAVQHFLGKDLNQAYNLFVDDAFGYMEDLMWMGPKAFEFYYRAFHTYLRGSDPGCNSDVLYRFLGILNFRLDYETFSKDSGGLILSDCEYCIKNYDRFKIDDGIYGDLLTKINNLKTRLLADIDAAKASERSSTT